MVERFRFQRQHPVGAEVSADDEKQSNDVFKSVTAVAADVEDYVVDLRARKIVAKLDCPRLPGWPHSREAEPNYWTLTDQKPNHHDFDVLWSSRGEFVLVNHTWRWDCVTFCAVMLNDGRVTSQLDLNKPLGDAVRNLTAKSFPRGFQYTKKDLNVAFSDLKQVSENNFSVVADAVVEKYWSGGGAGVEFTLRSADGGKILKLVSVHAK